jgi:hypothetical protein
MSRELSSNSACRALFLLFLFALFSVGAKFSGILSRHVESLYGHSFEQPDDSFLFGFAYSVKPPSVSAFANVALQRSIKRPRALPDTAEQCSIFAPFDL